MPTEILMFEKPDNFYKNHMKSTFRTNNLSRIINSKMLIDLKANNLVLQNLEKMLDSYLDEKRSNF